MNRSSAITLIFALALLAGCSSTFTLNVKDAETGNPVQGMSVERRVKRDYLWLLHIVDPISACYFPDRTESILKTDETGSIVYTGNPKDGHFVLKSGLKTDTPLIVNIAGVEGEMSLKPLELEFYVEKGMKFRRCYVYVGNDSLRFSPSFGDIIGEVYDDTSDEP